MNICLVLPKYGVSLDDPCCYPLGFMYVSAWYKKAGHTVKVLNYNLWDYDLSRELEGQDLVALTGYDEFFDFNVNVSNLARIMGIRTIIGGAMATFERTRVEHLFNFTWCGEIEKDTPIDEIPWPDYEGFGIDEYHRRHSLRYMGVLTSRGCPFRCTFCSHLCKYRERSLVEVEKEIDHYRQKYDIEYLVFNDNTLNVTKRRFLDVCRMMKGKGLAWSAAIRADVVDDFMLYCAKSSGLQSVVIGVESFNQERLDKMNKRLKVNDICKALDLLEKYNIGYTSNVLLGLDGEGMDDIIKELESVPKQYNVFPSLAQSFSGMSFNPNLTQKQRDDLNLAFKVYCESRGMSVYPAK